MNMWYAYSLAAAVFFAVYFLFTKKAGIVGIPIGSLTLYTWIAATAGLVLFMVLSKQSFSLSGLQGAIVCAAAVGLLFGTLLLNKAIYTAPNPGFATAVGSVQVLIVIFLSAFFFGSEITYMKLVGAVLVVGGVILLGY